MNQPYEYTRDELHLEIREAASSEGMVAVDLGQTERFGGRNFVFLVEASERPKAAQALAGDQWSVVHKMEWEPVEQPKPVDPADVKVGDVVEVEPDGHEAVWHVRGGVHGVRHDAGYTELWVRLPMAGCFEYWLDTRGCTVRRLSRAEPDPADVEALAETLIDAGCGDDNNFTLARELVRRGVRVTGGERS